MEHYSTHHYLMYMNTKFPISTINNSFISPPPPPPLPPPPFGAFIWPPRSYTCTFCRREFRSAQALGGHMNVHRRDRAKLKQSSPQQAHEGTNTRRSRKPGSRDDEYNINDKDFVGTKLSSMVDRGNNVICKRYKKSISGVSSLTDRCCNSSSMEEIDLELRLAVK